MCGPHKVLTWNLPRTQGLFNNTEQCMQCRTQHQLITVWRLVSGVCLVAPPRRDRVQSGRDMERGACLLVIRTAPDMLRCHVVSASMSMFVCLPQPSPVWSCVD